MIVCSTIFSGSRLRASLVPLDWLIPVQQAPQDDAERPTTREPHDLVLVQTLHG